MLNLKELRKKRKLTQADLAEVIGVSQVTMGRYETGEREMPYETLFQLADYFGVTIDEILGRKPVKVTGYQATELPPVKPGMVRIAIAPGENLSEEEIGRRITQAVLNQVPDLVEKELKKRGL